MNPSSQDLSPNNDRRSPAPSATSTASGEAPTVSIPGAYVSDKTPDDSSKLRTLLSILRKFIGVADIASVRFSLPAQLLEPTPNLVLDLPGSTRNLYKVGVVVHAVCTPAHREPSIGDSEDGLGRMLAVLRFWFTKDLVGGSDGGCMAPDGNKEMQKYVKGKPCKPYNSTLGEFFRCNWEVEDDAPPILGEAKKVTATTSTDTTNQTVRVSFLTEQTSHHPPVSAFWVDCPVKGITARGFDQLSAKFTGTSIRVTPGAHNLGIFITIASRDNEEYQLTHPAAHLGGLIRGSLSVTVADTCFVTCPKTRTKVILQYLEESWLGKTQNKVIGVIYTYDPQTDNRTRIKDVPESDVLARVEGCWTDQVLYTEAGSKDPQLLVDLKPLFPTPKIVPPSASQLPNESQRFWAGVTSAILNKQFSQATKVKQELEERQREKAAERAERHETFKPRFFEHAVTADGRPELTEEGRRALKGLQAEDWHLEEGAGIGA
ncbi:hypothetical protein MMC07_009636 [Pseudocyphellaria aurata]|nr:hypothetical protein [Pseudocyphellaria aurata]